MRLGTLREVAGGTGEERTVKVGTVFTLDGEVVMERMEFVEGWETIPRDLSEGVEEEEEREGSPCERVSSTRRGRK